MTKFTGSSLYTAMNQLSNHDHSRFLTRTNHKVGRASALGVAAASEDINMPLYKVAVLMQMTWPGAPTLYYGDEAGVALPTRITVVPIRGGTLIILWLIIIGI